MTNKKVSVCVGCVYASWYKTAAGRRHPDGGGQCLWRITVPFAESASTFGMPREAQASHKLTISGGHIQYWENMLRDVTCLVKTTEAPAAQEQSQ